MKKIAILTAGGDTPALNATLHGAVARANELSIQVFGLIKGYSSLLNPRVPHLWLNPLFQTIPDLDPTIGGTVLGTSRDYVDNNDEKTIEMIVNRLRRLKVEGLICVGGEGTLNAMEAIANHFPAVLAPKTIDNDLGLNYINEASEWQPSENSDGETRFEKKQTRSSIRLEDMVNYVTPGYATSVFVVAQAVQRIRTTAESHRRIAIIEVMGRQSGYLALGSAYGQPDLILVPEKPLDRARLVDRVKDIYEVQKNVVIVVSEGIVDETGKVLGDMSHTKDPAGNIVYSGAAEAIKKILIDEIGDSYFTSKRRHDSANTAVFTRKVGHTQRGGRPLQFDRFYASQLGGKAVHMLLEGMKNCMATLTWSNGAFKLDSIEASYLRDRWGVIHPRMMHSSFYDSERFQPSDTGIEYLKPIFTNSIGADDVEWIRAQLFDPSHLHQSYHSINVEIHKRIGFFDKSDGN